MSSLHIVDDVQEKINNSTILNKSVVKHQIEKKRIRSVGNFNANGAPFTTTATASSAKLSVVTSTGEGKSVVSSLSMSLERKDCIQYMPRKTAPCVIPAGQSTVIHLDNYTHFMAQRVTTTRTAIKRSAVISTFPNQSIVPSLTSTTSENICSSVGSSKGAVVDVNFKVLGSATPYRSNKKKTLDMNKQKMLAPKTGTAKVRRGRKSTLTKDYTQQKEVNKMVVDDSAIISNKRQSKLKPIIKKPKTNRGKKVFKPRQTRKSKIKTKNCDEPISHNKEKIANNTEIMHISTNIQSENESKNLRPCGFTMQNKKCISEMTCKFLHSDFPCKYYYLNLFCPQGFKCQFMHNGPLEPNLMEALRNHILELLSTKPSAVETHFIKQLHHIEDLTERLQSFQCKENENDQVIDVTDEGDDDDRILVIDESGDDSNRSNNADHPTNSTSNLPHEFQNTTSLQATADRFEIVCKNLNETNTIIDEIEKKLQSLKTISNMTPNEKIHELQTIHELLKQQEQLLPIYENINTATATDQMTTVAMSQSNVTHDQSNIVLVNPEIINVIQTSESQDAMDFVNEMQAAESRDNRDLEYESQAIELHENIVNLVDDEPVQATYLNVSQESGIECKANENVPQLSDTRRDSDLINVTNVEVFNMSSNMDYEDESTTNFETVLNNSNLSDKYNADKQNQNNENNYRSNNEIDSIEKLYVEDEQLAVNTEQITKKTVDKSISMDIDVNANQERNTEFDDSITQQNETIELAITHDEKDVIESHIEESENKNIEEESPPYEELTTTKPVKRNRIRLRSHTQPEIEETSINDNSERSTLIKSEPIKPIRSRRLRLPKPSQKSAEKSNNKECQISADIINKLIKSSEISEIQENLSKTSFLEDVPITQNVILTKRFMKKAKAKLEQQAALNEIKSSIATADVNHEININVEQNMLALHGEDHERLKRIENIDVSLLTQTSDGSNSLIPSQDPLIVESDCENAEKYNNELTSPSECYEDLKNDNKNKRKVFSNSSKQLITDVDTNTKRHISFEKPASSSSIKEQFNLGNPHVVLTKLKSPFLLQTTCNDIQADSTTTPNLIVNPIVTSSTLLLDDKSTQKRHSCTPEYCLDSSLTENKHLKIDDPKPMRKVNFDHRKRTYSEQSSSGLIDTDLDIDTDSSDEKLTIPDALQTSTPLTGGGGSNKQQQKLDFKPSTTLVATHDSHHHVNSEQQENESDLHQQIENVSHKSDLQLHKPELWQQQTEYKRTMTRTIKTTATRFITKNSNNLPPELNKQQQQQERVLDAKDENEDVKQKQYDNNFKQDNKTANTFISYDNIEEDIQTKSSSSSGHIEESVKPTSNSRNLCSNEPLSVEKNDTDFSTYSALYNKLSAHSAKCQINFENSYVNITPISSPTYGDDSIASPSPVRKAFDFRLGGEIDGRLTYPPIPYILHKIDLGKVDVNKPICIENLKKTIQLDPRIFRTHLKKQITNICKPQAKTSNALVRLSHHNTPNYSHSGSSYFDQPTTSTTVVPYDPRNRTPAVMNDLATTTSHAHQTALHPEIPNAVPLALQYHSTANPILQPQQQQTPNMFLYGCLQRSPWYQSLMSTIKIQINQSISQLVRALNNFHRERLLNPEMVFDVFKIDCAGELLEIMRNLGIFVDANGIINEERLVPTFGGRPCCSSMPVNATYSFIQQVLTPNTHCTSMATSSSTYNAAGGRGCSGCGGVTTLAPLNAHEPFVSCYIKAPESLQQKHADDCAAVGHHAQHDNNDNNSNNRSYNNNSNSTYNPNNNNRRYGGNQFKKHYDSNNNNYNNNSNNYNNNSNGYQSRSNQQRSYNNNPRFIKPGLHSPNKSNSSPPNSPRDSFEGGSGKNFGGGGGGRFNNNRRFNNYNNKDNNYNNNGSSWTSSSESNENRFNKNQNNNSPTGATSNNTSHNSASPRAASPPPANNGGDSSNKKISTDEECWDSDN